MRLLCGSITLFILIVSSSAPALNPNRSITQYVHRSWRTEEGLPESSVYAIHQTHDGYLWIGIEGGLARFDGVRFRMFNKENTPGLRHNFIWTFYEATDGSLWIGTEGGGVTRMKNGIFTTWTMKEGLPDDFVRAITEDRNGAIWVGTKAGGLSVFKNGRFKNFSTKNGLSSDKIRCLFTDRNGIVWAGTRDGGLVRIQDEKFTAYTTKEGLAAGMITSISQDQKGDLWIGTDTGGLTRLHDDQFSIFTTNNGLSNDAVRSILADHDGNLWIGTESGLDRMYNGKFSNFAKKDGLDADMVISLHEDQEKNLWIGTFGGGLHQLRDGKFQTFTQRDGISNDWTLSVYEDRNSEFWIGTYGGGLNRLRDGQFSSYSKKDGLLDDYVVCLTDDPHGGLLIGSYGGLNRWTAGKFETIRINDTDFQNAVASLYFDHRGSLWIGSDSGADILHDGKLTRLLSSPANVFYEDHSGNLWIGTAAGLNRYRNEQLSGYKEADGFTNDAVYCLYEDKEDDLWIGTGSGLYRRRAGKFTRFTTKNGLVDDGIFTILEDDQDYLWMSSIKGVFRMRKKDLNDIAAAKIQSTDAVSYDLADGMKSVECTSGTQPAAWKAHDGRFWYATQEGLSVIDPKRIPKNETIPPVYVEEMVADGRTNQTGNLTSRIMLTAGTKDLEFRYTALSLRVPERVKFRYKLEGYDKDWVDAGTRRVAYYTNLSPGDYRFRVIAANDDDLWNDAGAAAQFYLKPYFYQTGWFYLLCGGALLIAAAGLHRLRLKKVQREFKAVLLERTRIAREIHDGLVQALAGVVLQLETAKLLPSQESAQRHFNRALELARQGVRDARRAIDDLRPVSSSKHSEFSDALRGMAQRQLDPAHVSFQFDVTGNSFRISETVESEVLRICQEALQNIVKHSDAEFIHICMEYRQEFLCLSIKDNGKGFDPNVTPRGHFGLIGMRERAEKLGAELKIQSASGQGSLIEISVPKK